MLSRQERLAVIDQATDTIEVEGQKRAFTSLQRVRDDLWHNWALSEVEVDTVIRIMYRNGEITETFSLSSFYPSTWEQK